MQVTCDNNQTLRFPKAGQTSIDDREELKEVICVAVVVVQYQSSDRLLLQFYVLPIIIPPALATAAAMGFK